MATAVISVKAQNFHFGIKTGINLSKETKTEVERQVQDFDKEYNPQNEMFVGNKTKRNFMQNEMFFF